jgi:hypothetical protein
MAFEIKVLAWDRHKNEVWLNQLWICQSMAEFLIGRNSKNLFL